ncbi:hypothetical protein ABZX40_16210 [Streptomyces sp. NPDC004610]|uniref:hypothetical protein n=1 Tax=unclassified Streptomyces TaxID=2593676 RepID=UPI0033B8DA91
MPIDLVALMLAHIPDDSDPRVSVSAELCCLLEEHESGWHQDMTWELNDASRGEVWAVWPEAGPAERVFVLPDCNTLSGDGQGDVACILYVGHPGCHTFEYHEGDGGTDGSGSAAEDGSCGPAWPPP